VLERAQVQFLLDELQLAQRGLVDPATAARGGRLLAAERIVQGKVEGDEARLRMQAAVVARDGELTGDPVAEADALRRLFEMQKRLALGIFRTIGIALGPAEQERVMRQPTGSLEALLAFGACLEADDAGDFALAASECQRAATLDPGFDAARSRAALAGQMAAAQELTTRQLGRLGAVEFPDLALEALLPLQELLPDTRGRSMVSEALGNEGLVQRGSIEIVLPRP
jgi:hypothetical protein